MQNRLQFGYVSDMLIKQLINNLFQTFITARLINSTEIMSSAKRRVLCL